MNSCVGHQLPNTMPGRLVPGTLGDTEVCRVPLKTDEVLRHLQV